jgi:hypothetical protein
LINTLFKVFKKLKTLNFNHTNKPTKMSRKMTPEEINAAKDFFNEQLKRCEESIKYNEIEFEFEDACTSGNKDKAEKMLNDIPYLTKYNEYIQGVIGYVEDALAETDKNDPEYKKISDVLEMLRSRPDCWE